MCKIVQVRSSFRSQQFPEKPGEVPNEEDRGSIPGRRADRPDFGQVVGRGCWHQCRHRSQRRAVVLPASPWAQVSAMWVHPDAGNHPAARGGR